MKKMKSLFNLERSFFLAFLLISQFLISQNFTPAKFFTENKEIKKSTNNYYTESYKIITKKYKERQSLVFRQEYRNRRDFTHEMVNDGMLITDGWLYEYVKSILNKILVASQQNSKTKLYLIRENSPNAFNMGDNHIFVNIGLIYRLNYEEELALVLAHELGHETMHHYDKSILNYSYLILNDSIKKQIRKLKRTEYGRVSALNALLTPWILNNRLDSRIKETEADIFALNCLINGEYNLKNAVGLYDVLEHSNHERDTLPFDLENLLDLVKIGLDFSGPLSGKVESSLGTFEVKKDSIEDLLRTHPFGKVRKKEFIEQINKKGITINTTINSDFEIAKLYAEKELIISNIYYKRLDRAMFYLLQLFKKNPNDEYANRLTPFLFAYLGYEKKKRNAGTYIGTQSPHYDDSFNQLIFFLREISPNQCYRIAKQWQINNQDRFTSETFNLTHLILDYVEKEFDTFEIRSAQELDKPNNYYVKNIINRINNQK